MTSKGYKYSSYKRTVASTEYSLGTHEAKSTYRRETGTEYSSAKGGSSSKTKEIVSGSDTRTLPVYIAIKEYKPEANDKDGLALEEGQIVEVLDNKNPASWLVRTKARPPQTGWAPGSLFESPAEYYRQKRKTREITNGDMYMTKAEEALAKRDTVFHELMRTEEEYVSQLHHLINSYVKIFDDSSTPAPVRQMRDQLTMNLRELYNFHANVLLKGLQYYSDDPGKVGQTFVRLERDFDHHVRYFRDLPDAEKLLDDPKIKEFLDQIRSTIEKDRPLLDYLHLPQQRLQQYQQYIKELIKYTARAELSTVSLQRALELMLSIPRRATDLNYIKNIQDFPGDTGKLGRLLRHEQFRVWEGDKSGEGNLRYVFLFKTKLVFTERQDPEDPEELPEFKHVATIRLDKYEIKEDEDLLIFTPTEPSSMTYYVLPLDKSQAEFAKQAWVKEVSEAKEALAHVIEHEDETETMTEFVDLSDVKSEFSEHSTLSRKSSLFGPEEGPPRKKPRSPPAISPSASSQSLASSSEGMTTTGTLEMQGARVTRTQYGFRTLHESSAKMCLKVSGYPLPVITWFKDGVQLYEDERHKFYSDEEGFFAMTIDPVLVDDTGRYTCVATNEYGQATTSAFFRVVKVEKAPTPPKFITKLQDIEIAEGASAAFECEVEGWPEPEIQFFVDGQVIHPSHDFQVEYDGQKATLKIRDVQPEDAGVYAIRLINEMGSKESQAKLKVREDPDKRKVAPEFQQVIEDKTVDEGDTVKFKVLCTGDPEPVVTWYVNGHLLTPGENVNMIAEDGVYILTIKDVSTHFDGEITCRAVNRLGDISCNARLTVQSKAYEPSFEQELVDKAVHQGESVKFEVAIAAEPEPAVSWKLNGKELKPSPNIKIGARPETGVYTLEISKVTADQIGEIECHAENECGSAVSSAKLSIIGQGTAPATSSESRAPIIKQGFNDITVNVGDTLRLALTTEGPAEPPIVRWLLNGKELQQSNEIRMISKTDEGRYELVVDSVTKQVAGTIECLVENDIGSTSCKANITVTEGERPPTFKAGLPNELPVETGQSVKIQVNVDSKQAAKVTWLLNGKDVKNMPEHFRVTQDSKDVFNLEILDVTTELSGEIECRLETVGGKASSKMKLIVSEPEPAFVMEKELPQSVTITEGETLKLEVKIQSGSGIKKSTWELNGKEIKDSSNVKTTSQTEKGLFNLIVQKVTSEFSGTLACKVENKDGEISETKTEINVEGKKEEPKKETKPVIKTEPPKEIKTTVGESLEIVIVSDAKSDAKVTWQLNGKELKESANVKKISDVSTGKQVLQINEVTSDMSGEVVCKIENKQGAATATTKLVVEKKPEPPEKRQKMMEEETTIVEEEKVEIKTSTKKAPGVEPKVILELKDILVSPGEPLKLEVKVSGEPEPKVTWTLNGKEIKETTDIKITITSDGTHTLEVTKATPDLSGKMVCKAENEAGSAESVCQVAVVRRRAQAKPEFQSKILPITVAEGETLRVRVLATGDPDPRVKWYINDRIVVETEDTRLLTENGVYTLEIQGASSDMAGTLKCVAYNSRGEVSATAPIRVTQKIPVEFEQYLCDTTCREGDTLKLKAVLLGEPEPQVTWYVNGRKLEESQNVKVYQEKSTYIVVIKDITLDYSGEVLCKAVNEYGEASSSAVLTITPRGTPPDFTEWLSNVTTKEGATIKHRVVFTGDPTPTITWYVNNEEVKPTDENYSVKTEKDVCILTIKKFKSSMVGEVICKAENDAGEVSCTAQMSLATAKDEISERSEIEAMLSERDEISEAGTDIAEEMTEEHSIRTPTPIMAPKFITKIKDVKVKKGQQAIFECVVPDTKGVVVKWLKDGKEIELIARIRVKQRPSEGTAQLHQLIIDSVNTTDSGLYTCILKNEAGQELSEAVLEVLEEEVPSEMAPEFTKNLESITVVQGAKAVLECAVAGLPSPIVEWYKDGKRISPSRSISIESTKDGTHRLIIRETTVKDAGTYEVQISSKVGTSKQQAEVTVKKEDKKEETEKPAFITELRSITVVENEEIRLECKVTGKPTPDIKWFKNETEVKKSKTVDIESKSDGTQILFIKTSTVEDNGEYKCEAVNKSGTATTKAKVTVNAAAEPMEVEEIPPKEEKPSFVQPLKTQTVQEGETVILQCTVVGQPMPNVKFYKDGKEIKEDAMHKIVEDTEGVRKLVIQQVKATDIGQYKCEAINTAGKAVTEASLALKEAVQETAPVAEETAPEFTTALKSCSVKAGETAVLECAVSGAPKPDVKWYKDGKEVKPDATHKIEQLADGTQKLTILKAAEKDVGEYVCEASSNAGAVTTAADLEVKVTYARKQSLKEEVAPEFSANLEPCTVTQGETAVLECAVSGKPLPDVKWMKDGQEIHADSHHKIESLANGQQKLTIVDTTEEDIGHYTCEAVNAAGAAATVAQLDVKHAKEVAEVAKEETAPEFTKELPTCTVKVGETATLECAVVGQPTPKVIWMKDGKELKADSRHIIDSIESTGEQKLTVIQSTKLDAGEYTCKAVSSAGEAETVGQLEVKVAEQKALKDETAPEFTKSLQTCTAKEGETVVLECAVTGKPKPEVKWYKNDEEIHVDKLHQIESTTDGKQKLVIQEAAVDDIGQYRVEAVSPAGTASTEAKLDVKVVEAKEMKVADETAPEFSKSLQACTAQEGETVVLECAVTGMPKPEVKWFKNDEEIHVDKLHKVESTTDGKQKLIIQEATVKDIGQYRVEAVSPAGTASTEAKLDVKVVEAKEVKVSDEIAPEFSKSLQACTAQEGETVVLECAVTGMPKPEVKWFKNDEEIHVDKLHKVESTTDGKQKLIIQEATVKDIGQYRVEAVSPAGTANTEAKLDVKVVEAKEEKMEEERAPEFKTPLTSCAVAEGQTAVLQCAVTATKPVIRWLKDGKELKPSEHVIIESKPDGTQQLIIKGAEAGDVGQYTVEASTSAGKAKTEAHVDVQAAKEVPMEVTEESAPEFVGVLHAAQATEGQQAVLECRVVGLPTPTVKWLKDGEEVKPSDEIKIESKPDGTQQLIFKNAKVVDSGEYRCEATNEAGTAWTEGPLTIKVGSTKEVEEPNEVAPDFIEPLRAQRAKEGEEVRMECKVTGIPSPDIRWFKDGEQLKPSKHVEMEAKDDGTLRLIVHQAEIGDVGEYRCEASNVAGIVWSDATLTIQSTESAMVESEEIALQFSHALHEVHSSEGETAVFECKLDKATASLKPEIHWYKDGTEIKPTDHVKVESQPDGTQRLIVKEATPADIGEYKCEIVSKDGQSAETHAPLSVAQQEEMETEIAPEFVQELKELKANEGEEAVFECKVSGVPRPEVKWFRDGREIKPSQDVELKSLPDGTEQLIIHKTQPEDQGNYRISATNTAGSMSSKAPLTVHAADEMEIQPIPTEAPQFIEPLRECKANEGAVAQLECVVAGTPQPKIVWYKDNKPIQAGPRHVVESFIDGRQRLTIHQAKSEDIGKYHCVALNVAGKAETETDVKVEEKIEEPTFSKGLKNVKVKEGQTIQMSCQISMKNQKRLPEIKWYKNGAEIKPEKRVTIHSKADGQCELTILQSTEEDAGTYVCTISNSAGDAKTEATVTVEAFRPPEFTDKFEDVSVAEGATCKIETTVSGTPFPEVKWLKDGKELKTKGRIKIHKDEDSGVIRLTIEDAKPEDEGTYRCTLSNEAGTASAKVNVTVQGKMEVEEKVEAPKFVRGVENKNAVEGDDVTLSCVVSGEPFPEVFWFKGGVPLKSNGHYQIDIGKNGECILKIKNATPDDTASYTVKIVNSAGQAESVADVYVEGKVTLEPPAFIRGLDDRTVTEKSTVVLEVEVNTSEVFIKWLRNGQELKSVDGVTTIEKIFDKIYRLTIHSISNDDQGEYTAVATNEAGSVTTTGRLTVEKAVELIAPKFRRGLQDQTTKPGVQLTMEIEVEGKPKSVKWYKGNNELKADANIKIEKVDDSVYRLTFTNVKLDDAGDYSVEAVNDQGTATSEAKLSVEALKFPTIVKGLQDVQAEEGAKATFEVEVSGKPKTVKWYKNGNEISPRKNITIDKVDDSHYRLVVDGVGADDVATYRVEAGNEAGTVSSEAALTIKQKVPTKEEEPMEIETEAEGTLTIVRGLEDQQLDEGKDIVLEVELSAMPALLKWYKGGKELKADTDKRIAIEKVNDTIYRLTIHSAIVDDSGTYKVVATNAAGTVGSEAKLSVEPVVEKPSIVKGLQNTEAPEGGKVSLEIEVLGKPKQVKWYRNGQELSADNRIKIDKVDDSHYRLTISDVNQNDQASYKVEAINDAGSDASEAALTVKLAEKKQVPKKEPSPVAAEASLTIVRGLEDTKVDENDDLTFEIELNAKATSLKWYKGGTELIANKRIKIEQVNDKVYKLMVNKSQLDDGGTYKFEASNSAGTVTSSAKVSVQPKLEQPKIVKGLKNTDVEEGANVTFEVEVSGKPKTVKWYKNGKDLSADKRVKIEKVDDSHFRLTISDASGDDEATYKVELTNDAGTVDSDASLTVRKRVPKEEKSPEPVVEMETEATLTIVKPLEDQSADDGDNVAFDVELSDKPKTVKWYRNGQLIKPDKRYRLEDLGDNKFRLLITGVGKEDEATYKVEASKDSSATSSEAKLSVQGVPPKFKKGLSDKSATTGVKIILEIEVEGKPKSVKWYKNGKELKANKRILIEKVDEATYRLVFTAIEKDDAGPYKVEISNDYGTASSEGSLTVEEPPKKAKSPEKPSFSKPLSDQDIEEGAKVAFEVEVAGKPKSVKWYKNGREIKPDKRIRLEQLDEKSYRMVIGEAIKDDEATYKVEASNDAGSVDSEAKLTVHPPKPTKEPEEEGVAAKFMVPLKSETVQEDQNVSLTCRVKGTPFPEVAWLKDGVELEASERIQIVIGDEGKCELIIQNAKTDDTGTYTCLAQNIHGGDRTKCTLHVEAKPGAEEMEVGEPPEFVKPLRNRTVIEGEDLVLEVKIVGKPMPEVCWYKNGDEILPSERITGQIDCVSDEVIFRLHIKNARLDDTHTYKCFAQNPYGSASSSGKITVESLKPAEQAPAKFVLPLQETTIVEGKTAIFDVKVRGRPTPELTFYKDRKEITESARVHIEDLGDNRWRLTIENVSSTDAGLYECRCTNSLGSDLCEAHLAVQPAKDKRRVADDQYPPVFNVPLHDRRIPSGSAMTVECYVDAKPRAQVKWYKGETLVEEDDRIHVETYPDGKCRLRILNFTKDDEGLYKCVATNDLGTAATYANLTVEVIREEERITKKEFAPFFTRDLSDRKVVEGSPFTLECQVDGAPMPDIRWFKDGVPLMPSARVQIDHLDDGTCRLSVAKTIAGDMGAYRCVATNKHGASNSVGLIAVEGPKVEKKKEGEAPTFLKGLSDLWIEKGTSATLRCQVTGTPRPEIKWYKDGTIVRGNDRIDIAYSDDGTATLTIQDSSFSDEGFYRCVAENLFGSANSIGTVRVQALREKRQITLDEGEAPKFVVPLEDWSCAEGSTVEFDCKVTGKPAPSLKWYKDGAQLLADHRISFESLSEGRYRLTIQGARALDEGTYRCVASNEAGAATSKAMLKLEGPGLGVPAGKGTNAPTFSVPLRDIRAIEGNPIVLECKLSGDPLPDVKWYKDGELLLPSDRVKIETYPDGTARLYIDKCHPGDEGIYRVLAENPSGTANMKANVSVKKALVPTEAGVLEDDLAKERAPKVIEPLESEASKEGFTVTLACRITGLPTPTIQWFKDGERIYPFGRHQMEHKPDGTIKLTIEQLTTDDAGCYRCVAENYLGTARTTCQLTVEGKIKKTPSKLADELAKGKAPGFLTPLTVKRVQEGTTVVFECLPYGNPFPVIKWLKDGMELNAGDRVSLESLNDGTQRLTIRETAVSDEGFYRCVASNEFGTSSTKAELIVEADMAKRAEAKKQRYAAAAEEGPPQEQKPRFRRGLRNVTVNQGTPAEFEVAVAGFPQPSIRWYKNGQELTPNDKTIIWQDDWGFHRLVVLNAQTEDEAEYGCEITNKLGSAKSECSLHILKDRFAPMLAGEEALPSVATEGRGAHGEQKLCPPGFLRQIKNKHVFTGFPAIFDCIVTGNPDVTWYHNGKPIQPDGRIKIQKCGGNSFALVILRTTPEDAGEYVCKASNSVGTASSSAVLEVTVPLLDKMHFDGHYDLSQWIGGEFDFHKIPYAGVPSPPDRGPFIAEVTGHYLTLSWIPTRRPPPRYPQISYIVEMRELPDKEWIVVDYNIAQPCCKVRNMELGKSYQFRVRAENIYGISEPSPPSPPSQLMAPPKPVLDKRRRPIPLLDPYAQEALNKAYSDQYACAPWFAPRATDKTACAVHGVLEVTFYVYGFPDPEVKWYFRGWEIDTKTPGTRFETKCYGGTECVLKIKDFQPDDAGQYQCIARNVHGEAQQHIFVELASLPIFLQPLENKVIPSDRSVRLDCRIDGNPYPDVKWFKDWHPIVQSSRIKLIHEPPYLHTLFIQDPILRDTGIYTCTASNEAGRVSSTATLTIQAEPSGFEHVEVPPRTKPVLLKPRKVREFYEVEEEEIQKDPRFVVHRVTERATGRKFLAKFMPGKARRIAQNEIDLWNRFSYHPNLPYIWDAFDDGKECCIIYENVSGGGLLDRLVANERVPENRIAFFMRQLLQALQHMHNKNVVHLDLKPENIMLSENGSDQIKLMDFGLSRRLRRDKPTYGVLGAPEFVAPEVVAQKPVGLATDMWSVGVLAYVMLSGKSPFLGDSDNETLRNVLNGSWNFDPKLFEPVSSEAKDFISKLLVLDPKKRLDVHDALAHPWVQLADSKGDGELLTTQFLKEFKYRHQWVERRIFVQYGAEDEDRAKPLANTLDWLEPTYVPLSNAESQRRAEATLPLPTAKLTQRPQSIENQLADSRQLYPLQRTRPPTKEDQKRRSGEDDIPDVSVYVARGERRPIEDELASRILSDISEEGSVCSEEAASKGSSRLLSMESLMEDRLGERVADHETTPTQDDYPTSTVIKMAPGITTKMTVQIDEEAPLDKLPKKSPVLLSPTREEMMEVVVASKAKAVPAKETGIEPKALLPLQRSAKLADHDFERMMANAERTKEQIRQRLRDGKFATQEPTPRDMNGHDRERRVGRPLTDFDVPYPAYELDDYDWDSQYQMGPETFLLQLRDAGMATRVRDYRRHLYGDSAAYVQNGWLGDINNDITLRERRRYSDLIKNNKDLKEAARDADRSTDAARFGAIKRARGVQMTFVPAPVPAADGTHPPIFQTRLKDTTFNEESQVTLQCTVLANPQAEIVWFHNDAAILPENKISRFTTTFDNRKATLIIKPALAMDAGVYKCLAKNSIGESFSEAKLRLGDVPPRTSRPDVELASDTEVFITWEAPEVRGGSDIIGYKLEFRRAEEWSCPWFVVSDNLDEEAVVIRKLEPLGIYQFKVTPRNTHNWGEASLASRIIQTHARGAPKLNIELLRRDYHFNVVNLPHGGALGEIPEEGGSSEGSPSPSERREQAMKTSLELNTKDDPKTRFQLESEIFRGRFCLIRNAVDKQSESAAHCVAKVLMANPDLRGQAMQEYETLREIQHEHVVTLLSAYLREDFLILFLEKLSDNLIERFAYHDYYTEDHVARVMSQLLTALQWIHFKGICHLDLQPDNIMFLSKRSWNLKVLDTGTAVRLDSDKEETKVERLGAVEFSAPEVLHSGCVTPAADIWSIGLLSYLLLSGTHPFIVDDSSSQEQIARNIVSEKLDLNFIYTNTSQEALRFMTWALKKQPGNRMNTEEGLQHRWLSFHETMVRRRENIRFSANRLRIFARMYYQNRRVSATDNNQLLSVYGGKDDSRLSGLKHSPSK